MTVLRHLLAAFGLALACGGWVWLQRQVARRTPHAKRREGGCGACACGEGECREPPDEPRGEAGRAREQGALPGV